MRDCVTRLLLLIVVCHKVPVMHAEGIWVTLLCPAVSLAKPLRACHVLVLQYTLKELWCALKGFLRFDPKPRESGGFVCQVEWAWHRALWPWPSLEDGESRDLWQKATNTLWVGKSWHWGLNSIGKTEHCFPKCENLPARVTHSQLDSQDVLPFPPSPTLLPALSQGLSEHPAATWCRGCTLVTIYSTLT